MGRLDGRVALVTGGGRGFGRAIALAFGREGADVVVNYHENATAAAEVAREIEKLGRRAVAVRGDVAQEADVRAMVDGALGRLGRLDVLVTLHPPTERTVVIGAHVLGPDHDKDLRLCGRASLHPGQRAENGLHATVVTPARQERTSSEERRDEGRLRARAVSVKPHEHRSRYRFW